MMSVAATSTGIGVVLLSRRVRDGFVAAVAVAIVLSFALFFASLIWRFFDWNFGIGGR